MLGFLLVIVYLGLSHQIPLLRGRVDYTVIRKNPHDNDGNQGSKVTRVASSWASWGLKHSSETRRRLWGQLTCPLQQEIAYCSAQQRFRPFPSLLLTLLSLSAASSSSFLCFLAAVLYKFLLIWSSGAH